MPVATAAEITAFADKVQAKINTHHASNFPNLTPPKIAVVTGKRYAKVVLEENGGRSVYGFVEIATGDIFKAASFAAPAKHARGNIHSENCMQACTPYGIVYLR